MVPLVLSADVLKLLFDDLDVIETVPIRDGVDQDESVGPKDRLRQGHFRFQLKVELVNIKRNRTLLEYCNLYLWARVADFEENRFAVHENFVFVPRFWNRRKKTI